MAPEDPQGYVLVEVDDDASQGNEERSIRVTPLRKRFDVGSWICITEESAERRSIGLIFRIGAVTPGIRQLHPRREIMGKLVSMLCDSVIARRGECIVSMPYQR